MRALALLLAALPGCAPLTFSNDPSFDFERYSTVFVAPIQDGGRFHASGYLADELAAHSGFSEVTTAPRAGVDVVLEVEVHVRYETTVDSDGWLETNYEARATFRALTPDLRVIDSGSVEDDSSYSEREAVEDVLDEIVHHFLKPYRA